MKDKKRRLEFLKTQIQRTWHQVDVRLTIDDKKVPYNEEKDVVFYDNENPGLKMVGKAGEYILC